MRKKEEKDKMNTHNNHQEKADGIARHQPVAVNQPNLFIGVPCYSDMSSSAVTAFLKAERELPFPHTIEILGGVSLVPKARNTLAAEFLAGNWTHLLFVDSDIVFTPAQVIRLLSHGEAIVGGLVAFTENPTFFARGKFIRSDPRGLDEVIYAATGFVVIRRDVFERMRDAFGAEIEYVHAGRVEWEFFFAGAHRYPDGANYNSEGRNFCDLARKLGYKIFTDQLVMPWHIQSAPYPLDGKWRAELHKATQECERLASLSKERERQALAVGAQEAASTGI